MDIFSKVSISILVSIVKEFGKHSYNELQRNSDFVSFLKDLGLVKPKDDFENLYIFSLILFSEKVSNKLLLDIFKHPSVITAFKESQREDSNAFARALNRILLTDPEICKNPELKRINQVPEKDVSCFGEIYNQLLEEIKTPLQLEDSKKINILTEEIKDLKIQLDKISKSGSSSEIAIVVQRIIDEYKAKIFNELSFSTPLELLNSLENYIPSVSFSNDQQNQILSQIYFLQGWCLLLLNNTDNQLKFIQAYELSPHVKEYKEWGVISYYKKDLKEKAETLANIILRADSLNANAYSVLKMTNEAVKVTMEVSSKTTYKYHYINLLLRNQSDHEFIHDFFNIDFQNQIPCKQINSLEDFLYKNLLVSFYFESILNQNFDNQHFYSAFKKLSESNQINLCIESYTSLMSFCKKSKDFILIHHFTDANWLQHYCLFIKKFDSKSAKELYNAFQYLSNKKDKFRYENTLFALSQTKQYDLIVELGTKFEVPDKSLNVGIADAIFRTTGNKIKCKELLIDYCESISEVKQIHVHNLSIVLELYKQIEESPSELFAKHLKTKVFETIDIKRIIELYSYLLDNNPIDLDKESILKLSENLVQFDDPSKILLSIILYNIKEYKASNNVISQIKEFKKFSLTLKLYCENLISLGERTEELFELLSEFRSIEIDYKFLYYEIELYYKISDFKSIYNLSLIGCSKFPEIAYFSYAKIISLYYLDKDIELSEALNETIIDKFNYGWQNAFSLAKICSEKGKEELALKIAYKYTKENYDSSIVKDSYFQLYLFSVKQAPPISYNKVIIDTYVRFKINNEVKIKQVTNELLRNSIYQNFLDKEVGTFNVYENIGDNVITIEILEITDKFRGIFLEICDEISNDPFSGSQIISINVSTGDIEKFNDILIKRFGAIGGIAKRLQKEQIQAYRDSRISFSELVCSISNDKFFDVYYQLRNYEKFLASPPLSIFSMVPVNDSAKYVLDISSVILMNDLHEDLALEFNHNFIISNYTKEYFKILLKEEKNELKTNMSLDILETNIHLIRHSENQQEIRIKKLENINKWIDKNCHIGHAKNKLEILSKLEKDHNNNTFCWEYIMDTLFLANQPDYFIVTDDFFFYRFFKGPIIPISSELFFYKNFDDTQKIISKLIEYNIVGLTLSSSQLIVYSF
jgi:hypothetical protein